MATSYAGEGDVINAWICILLKGIMMLYGIKILGISLDRTNNCRVFVNGNIERKIIYNFRPNQEQLRKMQLYIGRLARIKPATL
jgi:hypothetical protein